MSILMPVRAVTVASMYVSREGTMNTRQVSNPGNSLG